jgi:tRNA nucleotidyltransferase/poly(A) polymerase
MRHKHGPARAAAEKIVRTLRQAGHVAYFAGGCVRDLLLKRKPKDWDLVSDATLEELKAIFPEHLPVGVAFGILKLPPQSGVLMDVAAFRTEKGYSDKRRPDHVGHGTQGEDQSRRDFTINALYLDMATGAIIDGVGGVEDLKKGLIRAVGDAAIRFDEDALRILRAARFSAQLGFTVEGRTLKAMKSRASGLDAISRERVREETVRALGSEQPLAFLQTVAHCGLWPQLFGVSKAPAPSLLNALEKATIKGAEPPLLWFAALQAAGAAQDLKERLRLTNVEAHALNAVERLCRLGPSDALSPPNLVDLGKAHPGLWEAVAIALKTRGHDPANKDRLAACQALSRALIKAPVWVRSQDLIAQGIPPGPSLGRELNKKNWLKIRRRG